MKSEHRHLGGIELTPQNFVNLEKTFGANPAALELARDDVHVWSIALTQAEEVYQKLLAGLSADEQRRAAQFKFEKLQKRFIAGRGALRDILSRYTGRTVGKIIFEYETHGKPKLAATLNSKNINFNLSHTEDLALCAVCRDRAIGVDVEFIRPMDDAEAIARRFFSRAESEKFCALPAAQKPTAFFNCWTRKEAFIKALGEGLSHPLDQFEVSFSEGEPVALLGTRPDAQEASKWMLRALAPGQNYVGALAVKGNDLQVQSWQWQALC